MYPETMKTPWPGFAPMASLFDDPSRWEPLPQYQLTPTGQPTPTPGFPLTDDSGMTLQPFPLSAPSRSPIGDLVRSRNPIGDLIRPPQQTAPATQMPSTGFGLLDDIGSGPSFDGPPDGYGGPSAPSAGTSTGGNSGGIMSASFGGGNGSWLNTVGDAMKSDTGRNALTAMSWAGRAFPPMAPLGIAAGIANGALSWGNMNNLDATRGAYGFPELDFGQRAGGLIGVNGYGRSSVADDFNSQMAQAIAGGRSVTVPNVNAPTWTGGLNPGEVADGSGADFSGGDQSVNVDGINYSPGDFGFW